MRKIFYIGLIALTSCASYTPKGNLVTIGTNAIALNNNVSINKTGSACMYSVLGLVVAGDASGDAAKRNAGITNVATADNDVFNILGIFGKYCTIVKGN